MLTHPQSFRALAYEVQNHLYASGATDDSRLTLPLIEQELRHQLGIYLKEYDRQQERMGQEPDPVRLQTTTLALPDANLSSGAVRSLDIAGMMLYMGKPYAPFVGIENECGLVGFVPVDQKWQLKAMAQLTGQGCYCFIGNQLMMHLSAATIGVEQITVTGIPADPFPITPRADAWYWQSPWFMSEEAKGKIKMQTLRVFMGTHIQLRQLADAKNNATEN